jgi:hypothetical protein
LNEIASIVPFEFPNTEINEIVYSPGDFQNFYDKGSLFIYHALTEGKLLSGDVNSWNDLIEKFVVQKNYTREINRILEVSQYFKDPSIFGGTFLTAFSNSFVELKNCSIFFNAHHGKYIFNKHQSIQSLNSLTCWEPRFLEFHKYYDYSVRKQCVSLPFKNLSKEEQEDLLISVHEIIKEMYKCL